MKFLEGQAQLCHGVQGADFGGGQALERSGHTYGDDSG